ncbi:MAG: cobalamin biosynthesis protein CbiG [Pseudomonadota bacterium]
MTVRLFDRIVIVDWSAAASPQRGANSIWIAETDGASMEIENLSTRSAAMEGLAARIEDANACEERLLIGFDFPFGYPAGAADAVFGRPGRCDCRPEGWRLVWSRLAEMVADGPKNANNRFKVAAALNAAYGPVGPFWGRPRSQPLAALPERKPQGYGEALPAERRAAELRARTAQPTWKLNTTGSVGGQSLVGIAALERLRHAFARRPGRAVTVWPFETGLNALPRAPGSAVITEVYPSLLAPAVLAARAMGEIADRAQVRLLASALASLDRKGALAPLFAGPPGGLDATTRSAVEQEEGWILGLGHEAALLGALQPNT